MAELQLYTTLMCLTSCGCAHVAVAGAAADVYIVCNLSCIDLPTLEEYAQQVRHLAAAQFCWQGPQWSTPLIPRHTALTLGFTAFTLRADLQTVWASVLHPFSKMVVPA